MSDKDLPEYFVEVISNVSHANGVFRVTLAQNEDESSVRPVARILIPANQLPRMLQGLGNAAKTIREKVREQVEDQQGETAAGPRGAAKAKPAAKPAAKTKPAAKPATKPKTSSRRTTRKKS